jgi:hypothetical protein
VSIAQRSCEFRIAKGEHFSIASESTERLREFEKKAGVRSQNLSNEKGPKTISQRMQFCVKIAKKENLYS